MNRVKGKYSDKRKILRGKIKVNIEETKNLIREFSDVTTLHGIRYLGERETSSKEKWLWVIALCVSFLFCMDEISNVWYKWSESPVIISYSQLEKSVAKIPLPALTICPENKVKKSLVDVQKNFTEFQSLLNGEKDYISKEQQLLVEAISIVCLEKSNFYKLMLPNPLIPTKEHLKLIAEQISPSMDDIFEACYFRAKKDNCSNLFRPILTSFGLCYSFNTLYDSELYNDTTHTEYPLDTNESYIRISNWVYNEYSEYYNNLGGENSFPKRSAIKAGPYYNLQVILRNNEDDLQQFCSMENAASFRFTVQSHTEFPEPTDGYFQHAAPGEETSIVLQPSIFTTSWQLSSENYDPHKRGCFFPRDGKFNIFEEYSKENCLRECMYVNMKKHCNCQPYYTALNKKDNMSYCSISDNVPTECGQNYTDKFLTPFLSHYDQQYPMYYGYSNFDEFPCDCLPGCSELNYPYHVTHAELSKSKYGPKSNVTKIRMYYQSNTFMHRHRSELYGVTDFIANCGGLLGLFTGFSLITAVEIVYFATMRLFCKLRRRNNVQTN